MELITIQSNEGQQCVNARELHGFLEVGKDFTTWIKGRIDQYGFSEGVDYELTFPKTGERKNVVKTDYLVSLDMAKELAMVERNERGKQARQYFIECEKALREVIHKPLSFAEQAEQFRLSAMAQIEAQQREIEEMKPKAAFHDVVTASSMVCQIGVACQVAKLGFGRNTLFRKLRTDGVLMSGGKRHNLPKQLYIERGLFTVEENAYENPTTGETVVNFTTHVTQKGIDWLIKQYKAQKKEVAA